MFFVTPVSLMCASMLQREIKTAVLTDARLLKGDESAARNTNIHVFLLNRCVLLAQKKRTYREITVGAVNWRVLCG